MRPVFFLLLIACTFLSCQEVVGVPPETFELKQNWPNPFRDTTRIAYGVPNVHSEGPHIRLVVYDRFKSQQVVLVDRANHAAMWDTVIWTGRNSSYQKLPSGIYYIELQSINDIADQTVHDGSVTVQVRIAALKQ